MVLISAAQFRTVAGSVCSIAAFGSDPQRITLRVKEEQRYSRGAQTLPLREYLF
jgi:hypothetical protein